MNAKYNYRIVKYYQDGELRFSIEEQKVHRFLFFTRTGEWVHRGYTGNLPEAEKGLKRLIDSNNQEIVKFVGYNQTHTV